MNRMMVASEYRALRNDIIKTRKKEQKKRLIKFIACAGLLIIILLITLSLFSTDAFGSENKEPIYVTVKEGDNLWNIAQKYSSGKDLRKVVYDIRKFNNMESGEIYPGMVIMIPVECI